MVSSVGVVSIPVRPIVAIRMGAVFFPSGGMRETDLRRVSPGELLSKEALQLSKPSPCAAGSRTLAACGCGDASDGRASLVGEVGGVWRVGAAGGRLRRACRSSADAGG